MEPVRDRPSLTDIYDLASNFAPEARSLYLYGSSFEERFGHMADWTSKTKDVTFLQIEKQNPSNFVYRENGEEKAVALRSEKQLSSFWQYAIQWSEGFVYVDITGFAHHVWAPLLRSGLAQSRHLRVVYVEPAKYRFSVSPTEAEIFDLSERIEGVAPLPGFASLASTPQEKTCFVPLLGFEGPRLSYLIEQVQPLPSKILPIIGVPGFRAEFPFFAYHGNRLPLTETLSWKNVRYSAANDPFSLFYCLEDIASDYPTDTLKIAPIGTKPHALGAVIYAMSRPKSVELIYDHPVRKVKRTEGTGRLLVFHVSTFFRN